MKTVTFRLRKRKDRDLIEAVKGIDQGELSNVIRRALRKELKDIQHGSGGPRPQEQELQSLPEAEQKKETPTAAKVQRWEFPKKA